MSPRSPARTRRNLDTTSAPPPSGQRPQQVVEVAVAAAGLVADLEAVGQAGEHAHQVLDGPHLGAVDDLALLVEGADRDVLGVDIQADVKHKAPLEVEERDNHHPWSHVTRSTEASFIVSHRL
jgi:hypothetical protein